jgi:hypothetical protein
MSVPMYPAAKLIQALDELDLLIKQAQWPLVQAWSAMMRYQAQQAGVDPALDDVQPRMDGLPPYRGG